MPNTTKSFELVQLLLMKNTSKDEFLDFEQRFQSFINQSPSFLHSVGKEGFFPSFFFGMFATVLDTELATAIGIEKLYFRFDDNRTLKIAALTNKEELKCITVSDQADNRHLGFSKEELEKIKLECKIGTRFDKLKKEEHEITIIEKEVRYRKIDSAFSKEHDSLRKDFTQIEKIKDQQSLESLIKKLENKNIKELKDEDYKKARETMGEILEYVTDVHDQYKGKVPFSNNESSYHGFLSGFLINFKYRYHLKLYLELFAGKGYADIILLVRGADKSLNSIPIIIELKAGTGEASRVEKALKQVQEYVKGYFSNSIQMVTTASKAVCVVLNFDMIHHGKIALDIESFTDRKGNSVIEKLLNTRTKVIAAEVIREQLKYLYYGIVWSSGGSDNINYVSKMILGQLILVPDTIKDEKLGKYIFIYDQNDKMVTGSQTRLKAAEESIAGCVTTIVLFMEKEVLILNINEMAKAGLKMPNKRVPIEYIERIKNTREIKIQEIDFHLYRAPSNNNPFDRYCKKDTGVTINTYDSLNEYKGNRGMLQGNFASIVKNKEFKAALNKAIKSGEYDDYKKLFEEISRVLHPFESLINNEATFQAVLHGLFSSYSDNDIKVITEFQSGSGNKVDMMLVIQATDEAKEYSPVGIELKFAEQGKLKSKEREAKDQLQRYKQGEAYKVITDSGKAKLMYAVFNKDAADINSLIKIGDKFLDVEVKHSSDAMLFGKQPTGQVEESVTYQAGPSRAVNY